MLSSDGETDVKLNFHYYYVMFSCICKYQIVNVQLFIDLCFLSFNLNHVGNH